ncbi:MAG: NADH-quinone oxidoreductase subunit A [Phycisphaerae bacterium]|nr:NADH-quinone oxidoreductase subunit A [Phycisphaerae bacterium]
MGLNTYDFCLAASDLLPLVVLIICATGITLFILVATHVVDFLLKTSRKGDIKQSTYESGMEPVGDTRRRFNVRFYMIAVLFLIFDVEIIFLYPWAVLYPRLSHPKGDEMVNWARGLSDAGYTPGFLLAAIGVFFALLLVGFIYEWRRGVFKWN